MKTKAKTFEAVAASPQWRAETSRMLDAMPSAPPCAAWQNEHGLPVPVVAVATVGKAPWRRFASAMPCLKLGQADATRRHSPQFPP
jgi:hypothetical protein